MKHAVKILCCKSKSLRKFSGSAVNVVGYISMVPAFHVILAGGLVFI